MSKQLNQVHFQSPEEALATAVDNQGNPSPRLLELLALHKIKHDGTLENIVESTQEAFHILHPSGRPKKRWEINFADEDEKYSQVVREQTFSILNEFGLFSEFVPAQQQFDYVFFHGSTLQDSLLRQAALIKQWQQGMRFKKLIVLSGPRLTDSSESVDKIPAAFLNGRSTGNDCNCEIDMVKFLWQSVTLPSGMEKIEYQWISSPDRIGPNGLPVWANTRHSFETWYESNQPITVGSCLGVSNAPFTLRQHIITQTFLRENGFANCPIEALGAPLPAPPSITICLREFSNVLWDYQHYVLSPIE